ncbi:pyridoxal phosphate-dependent transferase [Dactylonectria estremocensis]|uniref:acetylornithine transaminase n=1 Tax=Dactylonectria estremocensis TaxID=1079267 RepID=A0A9P9FCH8_9HYPO|nr:pyridoxal phosphate-dependent transferase [Dactylonectria estremocensis]
MYILGTYARPMPVMVKGEGSYLFDDKGNKYLDFTAGIAVLSLGHSEPEINRIINDQIGKLMHVSNIFGNEWANVLAEKLVSATKASGTFSSAHQVYLGSSGTEANEAALKFARVYARSLVPDGSKSEVVAFVNGFHGRTMGSLSATYNPKYREPFGPLVPGFKHGPFNETEGLDSLITDKTCAVIVEPVQGEGGIFPATAAFMAALRRRCDETKALIIMDEVQAGLGRSGSLWSHAHPSLRDPASGKVLAEPDILTCAKALGNGIPVGATIVSRAVADAIQVGMHGTTYGGNPVSSRVASYVVDQLSKPSLLAAVQTKSERVTGRLKAISAALPNVIRDIRGMGLMLGVQVQPQYEARLPEICATARQRGLLIIVAGSTAFRLVPPLNIEDKDLDKGLDILEGVLKDVCVGGNKL